MIVWKYVFMVKFRFPVMTNCFSSSSLLVAEMTAGRPLRLLSSRVNKAKAEKKTGNFQRCTFVGPRLNGERKRRKRKRRNREGHMMIMTMMIRQNTAPSFYDQKSTRHWNEKRGCPFDFLDSRLLVLQKWKLHHSAHFKQRRRWKMSGTKSLNKEKRRKGREKMR